MSVRELQLKIGNKCGENGDRKCNCDNTGEFDAEKLETQTKGFIRVTHRHKNGDKFTLHNKLQGGGQIGAQGKSIEKVTEVSVYYWTAIPSNPILIEIKDGSGTHTYYGKSEDSGNNDWNDQLQDESLDKIIDGQNCKHNGAVTLDLTEDTSKTHADGDSKDVIKVVSDNQNAYCCAYHESGGRGKVTVTKETVKGGKVQTGSGEITFYKHEIDPDLKLAGIYYKDDSGKRKSIKIPDLGGSTNKSVKIYTSYNGNNPKIIYIEKIGPPDVKSWYQKDESSHNWVKLQNITKDPNNIGKYTEELKQLQEALNGTPGSPKGPTGEKGEGERNLEGTQGGSSDGDDGESGDDSEGGAGGESGPPGNKSESGGKDGREGSTTDDVRGGQSGSGGEGPSGQAGSQPAVPPEPPKPPARSVGAGILAGYGLYSIISGVFGGSGAVCGVPRLYSWMIENFYGMRKPLKSSDLENGVDYFYVDMNALIHSATHGNIYPVVTIEDQQRMKRITAALLNTFKLVKPRKVMYIAVDGVCPSAKINQQRTRRFRLCKVIDKVKSILEPEEDTESEEDSEEPKPLTPENYVLRKSKIDGYDNISFNPNYISPGTDFMTRLDNEIKNWIALQTHLGTWGDCYVVYSGTNVPGEGEHKIYDLIRKVTTLDRKTRLESHLVYGLDADLMILSLITKMSKMYILREEKDSTPHVLAKIKPDPYYAKDTGLVHFHSKDYIGLKSDNFEVLSMRKLRAGMYNRCVNYVNTKFKPKDSAFLTKKGTPARLTDDFALLSFFAGNDFLPHLPNVDLKDSSFTDLINTYYSLLPKFNGFLTHGLKIHTRRLQSLMKAISPNEAKYFKIKAEVESVPEFADSSGYAKFYYEEKCGIDYNDKRAIRKMCEDYIEGLFWNLSYYHSGCPSWDWCYKYHYAPLASDLARVSSISVTFYKGNPITPLEHLLAVTPPSGNELLPPRYRFVIFHSACSLFRLLSEPKGELCEYFPEDFEICQDGKEHEWEYTVKLPFLNTRKLSKIARSVNDELEYRTLYRFVLYYLFSALFFTVTQTS
ncbi:XRN 5'-3' exonuclease family protein [Theileria equi strain WA]|uniref:XRN 5'-3' exonuclease family protein n=1 Tax=Theileria equi strain WA TaxID=1537102 RepID=L1LER9_THEEQ|nr:XRN 5'-3' exonuclease family protein [Theileria equi strain WA]EKX73937.1 XRN 5'-3' exonuclease family protein [Theileria equi strain WA]|eukprot:XP_004833389.1 XRN 5'-3' exonuclease family protein [Theileria equi strain WA]